MTSQTDAADAWLAKTFAKVSPTFVSKQAGLAKRRLLEDTLDDLLVGTKSKAPMYSLE